MKKTLWIAILAAVPAVGEVEGNWKVEGSIGQFAVDLVCSFKEVGNKLTGTCKGQDIGEVALTGETKDANVKWSYQVDFQGQSFAIVYAGTLDSPTAMSGNVLIMENPSGTFKAKKQ
jgi:hypothetical protein